ncbi:RcnB family protein [Mesorhizobium sp. B283B1A]|uniref:RcnB family protein n=1 Tax=Mesorhizobium TaxID=68287 RepID=UPI001CD0999C|nr:MULTISPECIES: RcnB family protein [Mesorhizobium]MCA0049399.1 RcnB family protein [Mesorhizobium sp. B283B1A]UQS67185.1 RcnB family protein [Mesorhizobium opportunistum]
MKRIVLSALAFSMLAATSLTGQAAPINPSVAPQSNYTKVDWQKPTHRDVRKRVIQKRVFQKKVIVKRNNWRNGQRYSGWRQHQPVRDYGRYGLRRPGPGQEWIRVGNDYVLVGILSGVIFGALAAH